MVLVATAATGGFSNYGEHPFDPLLAIHTSVVDPLPHQITGVYDAMLPRQPLRFLLADDPGAGKTIMAEAAGADDQAPLQVAAGDELLLLALRCFHPMRSNASASEMPVRPTRSPSCFHRREPVEASAQLARPL